MARRIYLHIGTMKAATTYLQKLFDRNRELLADHGVLWHSSQFSQYAIQDFAGSGMLPPAERGSWERLRADVAGTTGDVLVSMELLARMPVRRIARLVSELDAEEVRVIVTARDLSRVVPSHWQETTQNRGTEPWAEWAGRICDADPADPARDVPFWRHHHLPSIVDRWETVAAPGHLYLVTIPPSGGDPGEVWRRFATVLDVPSEGAEEPRFSNAALGATSAELMRRLNERTESLDWQQYRWGFKAALAKQNLARRAHLEPRAGLTPEQHQHLRTVALDMVADIRRRDVRVVGDLEDLVPAAEPSGVSYDPGQATDSELLAAAMDGLTGLGQRVGKLQIEAGRPARAAGGIRPSRTRLLRARIRETLGHSGAGKALRRLRGRRRTVG